MNAHKNNINASSDAGAAQALEAAAERIDAPTNEQYVTKALHNPMLSSQHEIDMHRINGHLPYRRWCSICNKAWGIEDPHRARDYDMDPNTRTPFFSFDDCFMSTRDDPDNKAIIFVAKEHITRTK